jgi:hypothetical protein
MSTRSIALPAAELPAAAPPVEGTPLVRTPPPHSPMPGSCCAEKDHMAVTCQTGASTAPTTTAPTGHRALVPERHAFARPRVERPHPEPSSNPTPGVAPSLAGACDEWLPSSTTPTQALLAPRDDERRDEKQRDDHHPSATATNPESRPYQGPDGPGAYWDRADALRWALACGLACTGLVTALDWLWVEVPEQPWLLRWTRMAADHPWRTGLAGGALCLAFWPWSAWVRDPCEAAGKGARSRDPGGTRGMRQAGDISQIWTNG